ncbi:MAG: RDD family protein [Gammaproteobacteria bacterium]|nr:RDD family protein [Gammaproteobacteria bacterium]NVK89606.1 RDD family protein [Gammaproteobacteria bacterium]
MTQDSAQRIVSVTPASPWKRFFAYFYDWLPAAGVFVLVFIIGLALANLILLNTPANEVSQLLSNHPLWWAYLGLGSSLYYLYCWQKGGQTVGMRTWRIKLVKADGRHLTWGESALRALLSCGGLANLWAIIDDEFRGWHDIAVDAFVVQLPKMEKTAEEKKPLI